MSETSEEKSKRNYLHLLQDYQWNYQHSLFYDDAHESSALLDDMIRFKQVLRRACPDQPFLIRIQLLNRKTTHNPAGGVQAYLVILTTKNADKHIKEAAERAMSTQCNVIGRSLTPERTTKIASAIKVQKPHDLERFFGKEKVNRFTTLNKIHLINQDRDNQNDRSHL